jgi:mRNA interferase MazF
MPETCALNFDHITLVQRSRLGPVITELAPARWPEVEQALLVACGFRVD